MKKLTIRCFGLILAAFYSQTSFAACSLNDPNYQTQIVYMNIGQVFLDPDATVGQILKTGTFPIQAGNNIGSCSSRGGKAQGFLVKNQPVTSQPYTYATNVRGIGIRLYRDSGEIQTYYPHTLNYYGTPRGSTWSLIGGQFKVDIIKTEEITGTGALTSGIYSEYFLDGSPTKSVLTSILNADGIQLVNPTCSISPDTVDQTIFMGDIRASELSHVGDTKNEKTFNIKLNCSGGNKKIQLVKLGFSYNPDPASGGNGVIANSRGTGYASGIGIQLLTNKSNTINTSIQNGSTVDVGATILNQNTSIILPLKARYYKTAAELSAGEVNTMATFNIQYQ